MWFFVWCILWCVVWCIVWWLVWCCVLHCLTYCGVHWDRLKAANDGFVKFWALRSWVFKSHTFLPLGGSQRFKWNFFLLMIHTYFCTGKLSRAYTQLRDVWRCWLEASFLQTTLIYVTCGIGWTSSLLCWRKWWEEGNGLKRRKVGKNR